MEKMLLILLLAKVMESQAGENFSVIGNHFIGEMKKMPFTLEAIIM